MLVKTYFYRVVVDRIDAIESEPYPNENEHRPFAPLFFLRFVIASPFLFTRVKCWAYTIPIVRRKVRGSIDIGFVDD